MAAAITGWNYAWRQSVDNRGMTWQPPGPEMNF